MRTYALTYRPPFQGMAQDAPALTRQVRSRFAETSRGIPLAQARGIALWDGWLSISPGLAEHQNKLNVVFDDRVRLVWFSQERRSVLHFIVGVGDFVPDNRIEIIKSNAPCSDDNVS